MPTRPRTIPTLLALLWTGAVLAGCGGGPPTARTTFLNSVDLVHMTDRMAESFAQDETIRASTDTDDPWVISIYRVVNHTNQIMPERERWLYIGRLRSLLSQTDLMRDRRIVWVVPPERWPLIVEELGPEYGPTDPSMMRRSPTHLLTAEFNALTQTHARGRSDAYLCAFQLVDLESGRIVWEDAWEVKRAVSGLMFD